MATLFLRSNNLHDIQAAVNNRGWTHTNASQKVKPMDTVVVFGNKAACRNAGVPFEKQVVLIGRLISKPYRLTEEDTEWPSNATGTDKQYFVRYDLEAMDLIPLEMIPMAIETIGNVRGHLNGGKYLE